MQDNSVIFCVAMDGHGSGMRVDPSHAGPEIRNTGLAWAHLNRRDPKAKHWLVRQADYLDRIVLEALLAEETRPRAIVHNNGILAILRGVNLNAGAQPEDMVSLRLWIDEHRIVSIENRPVVSVREMEEKIHHGQGPHRAGDFLGMLCGILFDHADTVIGDVYDRLDALEEQILKKPDNRMRGELVLLRRSIVTLRRFIAPQRDVIGVIRTADVSWLTPTDRRIMQEDMDKVIRMIEDLDLLRERAQIAQDQLNNLLAQRLNRNLYVLSVITAVFMPLTFLTGLLGSNIGGIPGSESPEAFVILCLVCLAVALGQIGLFKLMRWF